MKILLSFSLLLVLFSCQETTTFATQQEDYNTYLVQKAPKTHTKYFNTWNNKITQDSLQLMSLGIVAGEYNNYFSKTADVVYLKKAELALEKALAVANIDKASYARALARNYISQHRFKEALQMAHLADRVGGGKEETQALLFDVYMELGEYDLAQTYLDSLTNMSSFGYLIRAAKWNDYKGDLDTTITLMEKALAKAESSKNANLLLWSYTNIADYYGHAGRIEDSYQNYLKALRLDPNNAYAKKGIAWIVFSYEKNGAEALRILDAITTNYKSPDYFLLKAEIHEYMGNMDKKAVNLDYYYNMVKNPNYGAMYNAYNIDFMLDHLQEYKKALALAQEEVTNRPTPETYNLLAKTYLKLGKEEKALQITQEKIVGKTHEPSILLTTAKVYKANGKSTQVEPIQKELKEASYELGPVIAKEIQSL
ncbi:tetratricopeptide repeat protein [Croceivirga sp. JEA036]|uniref:tetratricopeptide repeat protein n=1 Tax=Croceivirga sp. JEA036 TaxID=2721162 RepID=UPI001439DBBC|nr:hypothetical protein [Croceivirga sp. JEA036]NJB37745.1 hypothetical protein [Croceivirga sp. JEA036]